MEARTAKPLKAMLNLLDDVPQSRMFDEMLKLLQTGHALASVAQLRALGLSQGIYPLLDLVVARADDPFVQVALSDTDRRVGEGKPVAPSFLLASGSMREVYSLMVMVGLPLDARSNAMPANWLGSKLPPPGPPAWMI